MNKSPGRIKPVALALAVAIVAIIAYLTTVQTAVPGNGATDPSLGLSWFTPGDDRLQTVAGTIDKNAGTIASAAASGVLVYGPYLSMPAGRYTVSWIGSVQAPSAPHFDVVSLDVGVIASADATLATSPARTRLQTLAFTLPKPVKGAEFRIQIAATDALTVESIEVRPLHE